MHEPNLRVVIDCVTFETVKITEPAKHFRADKVYLFHKAFDKPYSDFLDKVEDELEKNGIQCNSRKAEINDFPKIMSELIKLIEEEKSRGNHVYVNVSAGTHVFCSAALIACMMKGENPFYVPTDKYTVDDEDIEDVYFKDGEPVGLAEEVRDPEEILSFKIPTPDERIVKGLEIWRDEKDKGKLMTTSNIIKKLAKEGLMDNIYEENRDKVSQKATMKYRRNFLEKWLEKGWLEKRDRGNYELTEDGERTLDVFGE